MRVCVCACMPTGWCLKQLLQYSGRKEWWCRAESVSLPIKQWCQKRLKPSFSITTSIKIPNNSWYLQQSGVGLCWRSESTFSFCTVSVPITILPCSDPAHPAVSAFSPPTSPASSLAGTSNILDPRSGEPLTYTLHCFRLLRFLPHFPKEVQFFKDRSFTSEPGNPSCLHWAEDLTSVSFPGIWKPYWLLQVTGLLRCYMSLSPHKWSCGSQRINIWYIISLFLVTLRTLAKSPYSWCEMQI